MLTTRPKLFVGSVIILGVLSAGSAQAFAHVTVASNDATRGGTDAVLSFRVPTEAAKASTIEVKLALPTATPLAGVLVKAMPGWTSSVTTVKLATPIKTDDGDITEAVSEIDWKAVTPADGIEPEEFGQFDIIVGQLPEVDSLTFKAIQVYSDKTTVSWIDTAAPGSTVEPEHPAPELKLAASTGAESSSASSAAPSTSAPIPAGGIIVSTSSDNASKSSVTVAIVISVVALLLGAAGTALAVGRTRRRTP